MLSTSYILAWVPWLTILASTLAFPLFPAGLMLMFPCGLAAVILSLRVFRKRPDAPVPRVNSIELIHFGLAIVTTGCGVLGWMLIYAVVGR